MRIQNSNRLSAVPSSPIRKLVPFATAAKARGIHVYHLNIGDPDIQTPKEMISVLHNWKMNPIRYGQSQGESDLLDALVTYYHQEGYGYISREHVQVTTGGSEAIAMAMFAVADPGDEILIFEPFYANYASYAAIYGVRLVAIPTHISNGFHLPPKKIIEKYISKKTKAFLLCTPNNPTGTVYTKNELEMCIDIAVKHNLYIISDEVYREYVYDGAKSESILSIMNEAPDRTILVDSVSKRYSLCGVRIGAFVSLNKNLMDGVLRIAQGRLSAGLIDQAVAAKMTDIPKEYCMEVQREYEKRRNILYDGLLTIPNVSTSKPEGAFYCMAELPVDDAEKFCQFMLEDFSDHGETVMLAPAAGFYKTPGLGKKEVRIAYVLNQKNLTRCIELIHLGLEAYNRV